MDGARFVVRSFVRARIDGSFVSPKPILQLSILLKTMGSQPYPWSRDSAGKGLAFRSFPVEATVVLIVLQFIQ